jgi:hypothetical protein
VPEYCPSVRESISFIFEKFHFTAKMSYFTVNGVDSGLLRVPSDSLPAKHAVFTVNVFSHICGQIRLIPPHREKGPVSLVTPAVYQRVIRPELEIFRLGLFC